MAAQLRTVLMTSASLHHRKPEFTLAQVLFRDDMSGYDSSLINLTGYSYVKCKCKVVRFLKLFILRDRLFLP